MVSILNICYGHRGIGDSVVDHCVHGHRDRVLGEHLQHLDQQLQGDHCIPLVVEPPGLWCEDQPSDKTLYMAEQRICLKVFTITTYFIEKLLYCSFSRKETIFNPDS